jgi:hypothetical protein
MHFWKIAQHGLGGHGIWGHKRFDPACQSPFNIPFEIVVPSGFTKSAIVMMWRYIRTVLAFFKMPVVILGIWVNLSIRDLLLSCCKEGIQAFSIQSDPFISANLGCTDNKKLLSMYPIGLVVLCKMGATNPNVSWIWSRVTRMSFTTVLSYLSCFNMYGI